MFTSKRQKYALDMPCNDLAQYKKHWYMVLRVGSVDLDMCDKDDQEAILMTFQQIINSFHAPIQHIQKRVPLDFSEHILRVDKMIGCIDNENVKKYGESYVTYLDEAAQGKLTTVNYLILKTDRYCSYEAAQSTLGSLRDQIMRAVEPLSIDVHQLTGRELDDFYAFPFKVQERKDYVIYGNEYRRTYIVTDYPRVAYPNWMKPLTEFPFPVEISQHIHPYSRDMIIRSLEVSIAKLQSSKEMVMRSGISAGSEIQAKIDDAKDLLKRISSGQDSIFQYGMCVTVVSDSLDELERNSYAIEGALRSIQVSFRRAIYQMNKALTSTLPLCWNQLNEWYTLDSRALSTMLLWTNANYSSTGGILYGINEQTNALITFDRFEMPNPNAVIIGSSGYGKSMTAKTVEISRNLVTGSQVIVLDWSGEYRQLCDLMGGQYVERDQEPDWSRHLIIFYGDNVNQLRKVWQFIQAAPMKCRSLIVEEFHNILREDPNLILTIMQEIRKRFCAPTLITQNVQEFMRSPEGKMILDLCSIKLLLHLGDNDVKEAAELFHLTKQEKMYLRTCGKGRGYIYAPNFKTKIKIDYSDREERLLTTDPREVVLQ